MKLDTAPVQSLFEANKDLDEKLKRKGYEHFKNITPVKTGNARSRTYQDGAGDIVANYPYAGRLDDGYSKQAPKGMTEPTMAYMEQLFDELLKKE